MILAPLVLPPVEELDAEGALEAEEEPVVDGLLVAEALLGVVEALLVVVLAAAAPVD